MINLNSINLGSLNLGGMNTSEIKLGYPSSGCPIAGLKGLQGLYMGKGLTNEMMSRDPVWRDKSGKGNHIQLKNFGWKLQSGVGMYEHDFSKKWGLFHSANSLLQSTSIVLKSGTGNWGVKIDKGVGNIVNFKAKLIVEGLDKLNDNHLYFGKFDLNPGTLKELHEGLNDLDFDIPSSYGWYGFGFKQTIENANVKITLLPYAYENALCFDGVGDYGETIKDLNFTDNYSVVSLVVPFYRPQNQLMFGKNYLKDVYCNYSIGLSFYSAGKSVYIGGGSLSTNKVRLLVCRRNESIQEIKDVISGIAKSDIPNSVIDNPGKYYMGRSQAVWDYGQFAMFAHAIFDNYISDDELQILSDYWKKEFPELFPDQAWTVTGKSNSDADRAVIKNITGNGNDLTLTNFAFAENSGYGLYAQNFNTWIISNGVIRTSDKITFPAGFTMGSLPVINNKYDKTSLQLTLNVSGVYDNILLFKRRVVTASGVTEEKYITLKNGINKISVDDISIDNWVISFGFQSDVWGTALANDITIEQIPDYEGYLVTDGVDDEIISSQKFALSKDYTVVGDWKFLVDESKPSGIAHLGQMYIYNNIHGLQLFVNSDRVNTVLNGIKSLKAVCSNGKIYDDNWNEITVNTGDRTYSNNHLLISYMASNHTPMAFKNLGIYNNTILNKDQCIRAYNYLQTIKNN